jgi:hypothetical protein
MQFGLYTVAILMRYEICKQICMSFRFDQRFDGLKTGFDGLLCPTNPRCMDSFVLGVLINIY